MTDKLDLKSLDIVSENIEKIAALFPNCVTETANGKAIDFDLLKQELSQDIVEGNKERYRLEWPGKREAIVTANLPTTKTLRPVREDSVDFDNTQNIYIEGDNLEVLKLLQESYLGAIKMMYFDPPYNTGKDFVYKDDFTQDSSEFKEESGQIDEYNKRLVANPETSGRYHSDWLTMMYPRLKLARNLLTNDGLIFISIDDNEIDNLRKVCDEIFGESNALLNFIWELPRGINAGFISKAHEYILVYAKNINELRMFNREDSEESIERCNKKIDPRHPESPIYFPAGIKYEGEDKVIEGVIEGSEEIRIEGKMVFKNGKLAMPVTLHAGWTMKDMIQSWLKGEEVIDLKGQKISEFFFKENGKLYSRKEMKFDSPKSVLKGLGDSQTARKTMSSLFGNEDVFDYPKPEALIKKLISFTTKNEDIILDFFGGSSTTAHAIFEQNSADLNNRKFILVQIPELTKESSTAFKMGYENICDLGKERIRRAGKACQVNLNHQLKKQQHELGFDSAKEFVFDIGFRVFRLADSNMKDVYYRPQEFKQDTLELFADNIKEDRTADDLLTQILLDWGLPLSLSIKQLTIAGKQVFKVAENSLMACFDSGVNEAFAKEIATYSPLRVVFKDASFADNSAKENVKQLLKQLSPNTEMKVI